MNWVERICQDYGLTQYQLAKISGIRESSLSSAKLRGTPLKHIKIENIKKIADSLDVSMERLLNTYE